MTPPVPPPRDKSRIDADVNAGRRAVLIVNARSRRGARGYHRARKLLTSAGFTLLGSYPVLRPNGLLDRLHAALRAGPDLIVVGGGDGTIATAAGFLAHRDVALGVLPLGTTNNFARSLGMPMDLVQAVTVLRDGKVADVDLGRAGDHLFANMVSLGLSVQVAGLIPAGLKRVIGRPAYPLTALRALPSHPPFRATLQVDGHTHHLETHQLNVANGAFHHGRPIARDAGVDDRLLTVYRLGDARRLRVTGASLRHVVFGSRFTQHGESFMTTGRLRIETEPPMPVSIDGEVRARTPLDVHVVSNALFVRVSRDFHDVD